MSGVERRARNPTRGLSVLNRIGDRLDVRRIFVIYAVLATIYIYTPTISLVVFSFNAGGISLPFSAFTFDWYRQLLANQALIASIWRSIQLALVVTVVATTLATVTALAYRYEFWGKRGVLYLLLVGIIVPGVTYGIGAALFFNDLLGIEKGLWLALPLHVVWALPFSVIILLAGFPPHLARNEQAARLMGASRLSAFREVLLPQISPTILGAAVFAFTLSYNEGTRSLVVTGDGSTMPIQVFSIASSQRVSPSLFALGAATTVISTVLLVVATVLILRGWRQST